MSVLLLRLHRFNDAIQEARMRLEARPGDPALHSALADAYHFKGMDQEAGRELELQRELAGAHDAAVRVHKAIASGGLQAFFEVRLKAHLTRAQKGYVSPYVVAFDYAYLKDGEETLRWLQQAYEQREPWMVFMQDEPDLDFLHSDPRFEALIRNINLVQQSARGKS